MSMVAWAAPTLLIQLPHRPFEAFDPQRKHPAAENGADDLARLALVPGVLCFRVQPGRMRILFE